jgi:hypothetical protein
MTEIDRSGLNPSVETAQPAPCAPSMMPRIIQALSKRTPELAHVIVAIRDGRTGLAEAERRLPGMARLVGPDGHWRGPCELEAARREMAAAGDAQGVDRVIGNVTSLISGTRACGARAQPGSRRDPA